MPPAASTRKKKNVAIEASAPSENKKTQASRKNAPAPITDDTSSQLVEEGLPIATPASPKKRGRKPKRVTAKANDLPTQDMTEAPGTKTADEPTCNTPIRSNVKSKKAPVPARDPLPARQGRNTHPGVHFGLQPTPRRSSQQVATERERKRQALEEQLKATEALKQQLALMDLEDERIQKRLEEQGRRRLQFVRNQDDEVSSGDEDFNLDEVDSSESSEEDSPSPEPEKEDKGKGKGKGSSRRVASRALRKDIEDRGEKLRAAGGRKGATQRARKEEGEARFEFSPADLIPKKYNQAGTKANNMGYFIDEPVIGGLDDDQVVTERPASFGPISAHPIPVIPPNLQLQRNRNRGNKVVRTSRSAEGESDQAAVDRPGGDITVNKVPKKPKLKIRALTQQQYAPPPVVDAPLVVDSRVDAQHFICQPTWTRVFLPTLTHLFFVSELPFEKNNTPAFVAIVQEAFDASYPNVSYRVIARDDIVTASYDRLKNKRSVIASDALRNVKTYFEDARFLDGTLDVKSHAWWALRPDGLAYHAKPAPIGVEDIKSPDYIRPEGRFRSAFIIPIAQKFLAFADGSAASPPIGPHNPPICLYMLILAAVERAFRSFLSGTFHTPSPFSGDNTCASVASYREVFTTLRPDQWGRILDSVTLQNEQQKFRNHVDPNDLSMLSAFRGGLADFGSP